MVKLVFAVRRLPELSPEEFHRYWREQHGPLARRCLPLMGAKRYVQSHAIETPLNEVARQARGASEPYDGIAEVYWDSLEDIERALGDERALRASAELLEDERRFIDLARSALWFSEEEVMLG
ncbi:MAG: EthD family reductase [Candidatus Dadabacteria bacterium]|nr:MAG: EthD family reductase [Candidatus Dadabacteria bacterium]